MASRIQTKRYRIFKTMGTKNSSGLLTKKLIQWHLDKQWRSIKRTASSFGVKLIGDLPFYVSRDSVDVWSNKSLFSISNNGDLLFQSGGLLIIFHQQDNYGELLHTFGQNIKGQTLIGGDEDLKDNSS